jgi:ribosomal protein L16 Arg81 hydroxylase
MKKMNFEHLVAPIGIAGFFEKYWEKDFLHIKHDAGYFDNVLTTEDIDDFLSQQNLHPDGVRLVNNKQSVDAKEWTKTETLLAGNIKTIVSPEKVFDLFDQGATIILNAAEKTILRLAKACIAIEQELKIRVQANIYITPPNSQGFAAHYDVHDIFTMQVKGPKTWRLYAATEELPHTFTRIAEMAPLIKEIEMDSGDFLYIPRGVIHEAFSSSVSTIHVNFSCKPRYGFHVLERLAELAEQEDVFFRRAIPHGFSSNEERQKYESQFREKLKGLIEKVNVSELIDFQKDDFISNQTLDFNGRLADMLKVEELNLNTKVCRRSGFEYSINKQAKGLEIKFGQKKTIIPAFVETDLFFGDIPFMVSDIKGLITGDGKLTLVAKLIKDGFLQIVE